MRSGKFFPVRQIAHGRCSHRLVIYWFDIDSYSLDDWEICDRAGAVSHAAWCSQSHSPGVGNGEGQNEWNHPIGFNQISIPNSNHGSDSQAWRDNHDFTASLWLWKSEDRLPSPSIWQTKPSPQAAKMTQFVPVWPKASAVWPFWQHPPIWLDPKVRSSSQIKTLSGTPYLVAILIVVPIR